MSTIDDCTLAQAQDFAFLDPIHIAHGDKESLKLVQTYKTQKMRRIYDVARAHRDQHVITGDQDIVVVAMHPFFPLTEERELGRTDQKEFEEYISNLTELFSTLPKSIALHLWEEPTQYVFNTRCMLEESVVDDVVFTEHCAGAPLAEESVATRYQGKTVGFLGCYASMCVRQAKRAIALHAQEVLGLEDLIWDRKKFVLFSPPTRNWAKDVEDIRSEAFIRRYGRR